MKRILLDKLAPAGHLVEPGPEEIRHLQAARRVKEGEELELLDGLGGLALGRVEQVAKRILKIRVIKHLELCRESSLHLDVVLAIPAQSSTFDAVLPGLVQLGVNSIQLVPTTWSGRIKKDPERYLDRLNNIAMQSLKQCGRARPPQLGFAEDWPTLCARFASRCEINLVFHPGRSQQESLTGAPKSLGLLIGAEAGFTEEEVDEAVALGLLTHSLGPRILKMETAVIGACFWAQAQFGDLL